YSKEPDGPDGEGGPAVDAHLRPGAIAATSDVVYFDDGPPSRLRGIDRHTGIVRTYLDPFAAYVLAIGPAGQLLAVTDSGIETVAPAHGTTSVLTGVVDACIDVDTITIRPQFISASGAGIAFVSNACHNDDFANWMGWIGADGSVHPLIKSDYSMVIQ